jgi:CheY-like chemotaxis protein
MMVTTVLVVDDDADVRETIRDTLEMEGYRTLEAADGVQALAAIRKEVPDLIVTDLAMPVMDGWELIDALERRRADIPTLVMTGEEDPAVNRTKTPVLNKPVLPRELLEKVAEYR